VAHVELTSVCKSYGAVRALDRLSLGLAEGECIALLGPSGCGKTTALNIIAGFLIPDSGEVRIGGHDMATVPTHKRNAGMVFQSYALFAHLTVFDNVAFGLKMRKVEKVEIAGRVREALALVRLDGMASRFPRQLSGGQQQRVALARALVIRPELLLLDEPLSNLDAKLRQEMRTELMEILRRVRITTIFVTHDQEEALALADRVVIMNHGRIEQIGTPSEVYEEPATSFVATFLGEANILRGTVAATDAEGLACDVGGGVLVRSARTTTTPPGGPIEVVVRSERLRLSPHPTGLANSFPAILEHVVYLGSEIRYFVRLGEHRLVAVEKNRGDSSAPAPGAHLYLEWSARDSLVTPVRTASE
jgi:putative spermidine/putrescine transport system ATP-binding protein